MRIKKLLLSSLPFVVLFSIVFAVGLYFGQTPERIYIRSSNDIYKIREHLDGNFVFSCKEIFITAESWKPIGTKEKPFKGTIDGKGVKISFTSGSIKTSQYEEMTVAGFFGVNMGIIQNCDFYIGREFSFSLDSRSCCFGMISAVNGGKLINCNVSGPGSFTLNNIINDCYIGGLVGINSGTIYKSSFSLNVNLSCSKPASLFYGGIAGKIDSGTIERCITYGKTSSFETFKKSYCGGIVGIARATNNVIKDCASYLRFKPNNNVFTVLSSTCSLVLSECQISIANCYLSTQTICSSFLNENAIINTGLLFSYESVSFEAFLVNCFSNFNIQGDCSNNYSFSNRCDLHFDNLYYANKFNDFDSLLGAKASYAAIELSELKWSETIWEKTSSGFVLK